MIIRLSTELAPVLALKLSDDGLTVNVLAANALPTAVKSRSVVRQVKVSTVFKRVAIAIVLIGM